MGELTSGGGILSGELIFAGEENGLENVLDAALARIFSLSVFSGTSERATCLDPGVDQILTTTNIKN